MTIRNSGDIINRDNKFIPIYFSLCEFTLNYLQKLKFMIY